MDLSIPFVGFLLVNKGLLTADDVALSIPFVGFLAGLCPAEHQLNQPFNSICWILADYINGMSPSEISKLSIPFVGFPCLAMVLKSPLWIRNSVQ